MTGSTGRHAATESTNGTAPDRHEVEREIERTREQLARDIDQLAAKADVVGRTRRRVDEVGQTRVIAVVGLLAAAVVTVVVVRRRRGGRR
ncbi:DUF3618 domain-containing protein [Nocardioides caeni]|uniref:DUF3618 domain-containing protein n=1 Tax=Nocardioides caeni TaxID=574700 RepID=A0A4S8NLP5_9ACTN|nr:DUF3618 domain-containing protein [Nocardioides caeni]THV17907.1 DUF3618 domain-containing protein [Nocardioides caeni]